jgi:hypothetical protein
MLWHHGVFGTFCKYRLWDLCARIDSASVHPCPCVGLVVSKKQNYSLYPCHCNSACPPLAPSECLSASLVKRRRAEEVLRGVQIVAGASTYLDITQGMRSTSHKQCGKMHLLIADVSAHERSSASQLSHKQVLTVLGLSARLFGANAQVLSPDPIFINSQEIPPNTWYPLYGDLKAVIWSPLPGGRIEGVLLGSSSSHIPDHLRCRAVSAAPSTCYESTSSTFPFLTSLHLALERRRILARRAIRTRKSKAGQTNGHEHDGETDDSEAGPRVMVLGPANAGKSTMIKNLVNLALGSGMGWAPVVVSLDPSNVSIPSSRFVIPLTDLAVATSRTRQSITLNSNPNSTNTPSIASSRLPTHNIRRYDARFGRAHCWMVHWDIGTSSVGKSADVFPALEEGCWSDAGCVGAEERKRRYL